MRGECNHVISEMAREKGFGLLAGSLTSLSGGYMSPFALWKFMNLCALFFFKCSPIIFLEQLCLRCKLYI